METSSNELPDDQTDDSLAKRNVLFLFLAQAFAGSIPAIVIITGGLVGARLAPDPSFSTLPVSFMIIGVAFATVPINLLMRNIGRRNGYYLGATVGMVASLMAAYFIWNDSFYGFAFSMFLLGGHWAFAQSYRFAAADTASTSFKPKAISWVMAGGIVSAFIAPQTVVFTEGIVENSQFAGTFVGAAVLCLITFAIVSQLDIPKPEKQIGSSSGRPLAEIIVQPKFIVAVLCGATSYLVMAFVMTASPLAMIACGHPIDVAAYGIQWHIAGMYGTGIISGPLIARFGSPVVIALGMTLLTGAALIAISGISVTHFWFALILLGIGWNFGFVGGTSMVTETYRPEEKNKVHAANDFLVFGANTIASLSAGIVFINMGWEAVNYAVLPMIAFCFMGLAWYGLKLQRIAPGV